MEKTGKIYKLEFGTFSARGVLQRRIRLRRRSAFGGKFRI